MPILGIMMEALLPLRTSHSARLVSQARDRYDAMFFFTNAANPVHDRLAREREGQRGLPTLPDSLQWLCRLAQEFRATDLPWLVCTYAKGCPERYDISENEALLHAETVAREMQVQCTEILPAWPIVFCGHPWWCFPKPGMIDAAVHMLGVPRTANLDIVSSQVDTRTLSTSNILQEPIRCARFLLLDDWRRILEEGA